MSPVSALSSYLARPVPRRAPFVAHLGRLAAFLFALEVVTGVLLAFYYRPTPAEAFDSVRVATNHAAFGWFVRGVHRVAAHGLVAVAGLALCRAFFRRSFLDRFGAASWGVRATLVFVAVLLLLTGQMLPWTDAAYWRAVSATSALAEIPFLGPWLADLVRGGATVGGATLVRLYALHALVLPGLALGGLLLARHLWHRRQEP